MPDSSFPVKVVQGVPVVTAPEEIDITNAETLRAALLKTAASGHGMLAVDMTRTRFCDSSGLHALLAAHKRAQAEGREVRLVIPSTATAVLRVFAITSVDRIIPNFTSLTEALAPAAAPANGRSRQRPEGEAAPKTGRGLAPAGQLPGTIERSSKEAQESFTRALTRAVQSHGQGDQAVRAAYAEFKRTFEKCGDHWIPKQAVLADETC
jgi:anti-sigma B factor antagonist